MMSNDITAERSRSDCKHVKIKSLRDKRLNYTLPYYYHTIHTSNNTKEEALKSIGGKGENAGNQHFLLLPRCFLPFPGQIQLLK